MSETEAKTSSKMDMALDDIIKTTRKPRQGGGRGGRGGRGGQRRGGQGRGGFGGRGGKGNPGLKTSGSSKLTIKNLDHGVTDSDIYELFSEFGSMKSATIHYNRNGQSQGTAIVTFARGQDAMRAMKQYNGVHLDGRAMRVSMEQGAGGMVKRLGQGGRGGGGQGKGRGRGRGGRGGRGGGRGGKSDSKPKTAEELDAEMDAYLQKKPTTADDLDKEMDAYANKKGEKVEES